ARAPGRALENEAHAVGPGDRDVALEIADESGAAFLRPHHVEGREVGQVQTIVEDQRRLYATVGEKQATVELRKAVAGQTHRGFSLLAHDRDADWPAPTRRQPIRLPGLMLCPGEQLSSAVLCPLWSRAGSGPVAFDRRTFRG